MPFDTITATATFAPFGISPSKPEIWGYHCEREPFSFTFPALSLPRVTWPEITLPNIQFPVNAIPTSTVTALVVFAFCLTMAGPKPYLVYGANSIPDRIELPATQLNQNQSKVSIRGVELPKFDSISVAAQPMAARALPKVTQHGGFESVYKAAGKKYQVPWQLVAAVHYVESGQSGDNQRVSSAGAMGPLQFMPDTFAHYAVDGDGDGRTSIYDVHDSIYAAARYLSANGAGRGQMRQALYRYNHSAAYVEKVLAYAAAIGR